MRVITVIKLNTDKKKRKKEGGGFKNDHLYL
jgi:hypothetical protein